MHVMHNNKLSLLAAHMFNSSETNSVAHNVTVLLCHCASIDMHTYQGKLTQVETQPTAIKVVLYIRQGVASCLEASISLDALQSRCWLCWAKAYMG